MLSLHKSYVYVISCTVSSLIDDWPGWVSVFTTWYLVAVWQSGWGSRGSVVVQTKYPNVMWLGPWSDCWCQTGWFWGWYFHAQQSLEFTENDEKNKKNIQWVPVSMGKKEWLAERHLLWRSGGGKPNVMMMINDEKGQGSAQYYTGGAC